VTTQEEPSTEGAESQRTRARRGHWLLLLIPAVWNIMLAPWANSVGYVFGDVPFLLLWMIAGVIIGSLAIGIVYQIDRARGQLEIV